MDADLIMKLDNIDAGIRMLEARMTALEATMRQVIGALNESVEAYNSLIEALSNERDDDGGTEYDLSGNPYPASRQ